MLAPTPAISLRSPAEPPLTFPPEVWEAMSTEYRAACESAQALLDAFGSDRTLGLRDARRRTAMGLDEALRGLEVLKGMDLIQVEPSEHGPAITLRARPEGHVRITGLDGRLRWVFIARPLDEPDVDDSELN